MMKRQLNTDALDPARNLTFQPIVRTLTVRSLVGLIWLYRLILSPLLSGHCRFEPSCSSYAEQAIQKYGPASGARLALKRLLRCHPWGPFGSDPVP